MNPLIKHSSRALLLLAMCASIGCQPNTGGDKHGEHSDDHEDHNAHDEHGDHEDHDTRGEPSPKAVTLSEIARRRAGITIETVSARALTNNLRIIAEVELAPNRVAHISPLLSGQLTEVSGEIGARVKQGDKLAELRSVEVSEASARLASAKASVKLASETLARQERLRRITSLRSGSRWPARHSLHNSGICFTPRAEPVVVPESEYFRPPWMMPWAATVCPVPNRETSSSTAS